MESSADISIVRVSENARPLSVIAEARADSKRKAFEAMRARYEVYLPAAAKVASDGSAAPTKSAR